MLVGIFHFLCPVNFLVAARDVLVFLVPGINLCRLTFKQSNFCNVAFKEC